MNTLAQVFEKEVEYIKNLQQNIKQQTFDDAIELVSKCKGKIVVTGVGKSGHIASKIAATMASTGTPAFFVHPGEACHGDLGMIESNDLVIAISHSGESAEIMTILPICKNRGIKIITITSKPESSMAKIADIHLCTYVTEEAGPLNLAPTCSTTATLVLGDALAIALSSRKNFTKQEFAASHPGGALGKKLLVLNKNIMHTGNDIPLVTADQNISEAILEMTSKKLGFTAVIKPSDHKLAGIFTDGDLRRILSLRLDLNNTKIGSVATEKCITVKPDEKASLSLSIMQKNNIMCLLVTDEQNHVIGAFNFHDLINAGIKQ